jgi:16S rRNA (adenine1518-N6/adenine1519-N6)-dimethyltransferase
VQSGQPADEQAGQQVRLLGAADIRDLAARLRLRPSRRLGQHFVIDPGTVRRIAAMAVLAAEDVVLEVGPGFGSLTLPLLQAARAVIAVEMDPALAAELPGTVSARAPGLAGRLRVVCADAARVGAGDLTAGQGALAGLRERGGPAGPDVLVANLPYNAAVPILLNLLAAVPSLRRGLVMVQAEAADRMTARPGSRVYGAPSVKLGWFAEVRRAGPVPRTVFWPVPRVDSALVTFTRRDPPAELDGARDGAAQAQAGARADPALRGQVFAAIDAAFAQRRKTLRAALAPWAGSAAAAERVLRAAGIDPGLRGEALDLAQFTRLATARSGELTMVNAAVVPGGPHTIG